MSTAKFLQVVNEGTSESGIAAAISKLEKHLGTMYRLPGIEKFKKKDGESGQGLRYFFGKRSVRFNLKGGKLDSVDIWTGKTFQPNFTLRAPKNLLQVLPHLASLIKNPSIGKHAISEQLREAAMAGYPEAFSGVMDFLDNYADGDKTFGESEIGRLNLGSRAFQVFHEIARRYPNVIEQEGRKYRVIGKLEKIDRDKILKTKFNVSDEDIARWVEIEKAREEEIKNELAERHEEEMKEGDRIPYEQQLADMEKLIKNMVKKDVSNAVFIIGRGGTGKTHTVEKTLHEAGLKDGSGYVKLTTTATPSAMYKILADNPDSVVVFDDADSALEDQEGRNLIKAATDTRKVRKISWAKTASWVYDANKPPKNTYDYDGWLQDQKSNGNYPKSFEFTGKVIFISNLSLKKLDPDGALRTRGFIINVDPGDDELIQHMRKIVNNIPLPKGSKLTDEERMEVVDVIASYKGSENLQIRKLVRGLQLRAAGVPDWKDLMRRYA